MRPAAHRALFRPPPTASHARSVKLAELRFAAASMSLRGTVSDNSCKTGHTFLGLRLARLATQPTVLAWLERSNGTAGWDHIGQHIALACTTWPTLGKPRAPGFQAPCHQRPEPCPLRWGPSPLCRLSSSERGSSAAAVSTTCAHTPIWRWAGFGKNTLPSGRRLRTVTAGLRRRASPWSWPSPAHAVER